MDETRRLEATLSGVAGAKPETAAASPLMMSETNFMVNQISYATIIWYPSLISGRKLKMPCGERK